MEEGSELLERLYPPGAVPLAHVHLLLPRVGAVFEIPVPRTTRANLSTAKSPQQMFGAVAKSYFAEKLGLDPHKVFVVSIMPCSAKKAECELPTMNDACGDPDVDVVLTTREMCRLFRSDCIMSRQIWKRKPSTAPWAPAPARRSSSAPPAA